MSQPVPEWVNNLCDPDYAKKLKGPLTKSVPSPPGCQKHATSTGKQNRKDSQQKQKPDVSILVIQKAWEIAFQPARSIPMNMIVSYMSGSSLQIISIMTALMFVSNPIKSIVNIRRTFKPVLGNSEAQSQVVLAMVMFVVFQIVLMGIGVHKLNSMGLIPNKRSDWLFLEEAAVYREKTYAF
ncbi:LADA_0G15896g1_1 [Lachancea dasiensis]|uniref:ER membrane protein complex subunit 4 n=1 Tax=Lachancea dasiensis TaxID=1072105 RepID=A0A1G4JWS7_9SACH|nr:LADA_0G15896g1_1 [Lachancea dasiensis]